MLRSALFAAAFYTATALFLVLGSPLLLGPRRYAMMGLKAHAIVSLWLLEKICGTRMEVRGLERVPAGPYLVVAKHQSAWDTFALVPLFRDPAIVLKDELKWIPLYGWFCVKFAHILVKRDKGAGALKTMIRDARARASDGREIVIFPEGTRRPPGAPPDYKPGYVALYEGLDIACVPLALNSGLYWPRRKLMRYPGTIVVELLEPLPPGMARAAFRDTVVARIEAASARLIDEAARGPSPPPLPSAGRTQPAVEA
ncbi:MAG: lysophospholipid acyltransferase family protein [Pseudomonadota bacterium]